MKQSTKFLVFFLFIFLSLTFVFAFNLNSNIFEKNILKVTSEHPFLINGEWVKAKDLNVGDELTSIDGRKVRIKKIKDIVDEVEVYNLEVKNYSDFIVNGLVVHNSNLPLTGIGADPQSLLQYELLKKRLEYYSNFKESKIWGNYPTGVTYAKEDYDQISKTIRDHFGVEEVPEIFSYGSLIDGKRVWKYNDDGVKQLSGWKGQVPDELPSDAFYLSDVDLAITSPTLYSAIESGYPELIQIPKSGSAYSTQALESSALSGLPTNIQNLLKELAGKSLAGQNGRTISIKIYRDAKDFLKDASENKFKEL